MSYSRRKVARTPTTPYDLLAKKLNFYRYLFCFSIGFLTCLFLGAL